MTASAEGVRGQSPRLDPATVLTAVGAGSVVLGGLVAAFTGPLELARGSWLAAYLVLVGGAAQYTMGRARSPRSDMSPPQRSSWAQVGCWNGGNALVIGGTLAGAPPLVDLGSALLVVALVIAFRAACSGRLSPLIDRAYRAMLLVLALSIPVGVVLSHLRHS